MDITVKTNMDILSKSWEELKKARAAIEAMRNASDLSTLEAYWQEFLHRLERSWNKSVSYMKRSPRFQGWVERGHTLRLREQDPLLCYLRNARGADEHTVEAIVEREPGIITVSSADQKPMMKVEVSFPIENGTTVRFGGAGVSSLCASVLLTKNPDPQAIVANQPVVVDFKAAKLKLIQIINRGRTYYPPTAHLGHQLNELGPIEAAEIGLKFYESYYNKAEEYFRK